MLRPAVWPLSGGLRTPGESDRLSLVKSSLELTPCCQGRATSPELTSVVGDVTNQPFGPCQRHGLPALVRRHLQIRLLHIGICAAA